MFDFYFRSSYGLLAQALRDYPVVVVTGSRQSGNSKLLKTALSRWPVVSLEDLDLREFAQRNARVF